MPAYNPPNGGTTDFDFSTGVQAYNPPNGQYADFDFSILEDVFNPYFDTGFLSSGGVSIGGNAYGGKDRTNSGGLLRISTSMPKAGASLHIMDMPSFRTTVFLRGRAYVIPSTVARKVNMSLGIGGGFGADYHIKDGAVPLTVGVGYRARGGVDSLGTKVPPLSINVIGRTPGSIFIADTVLRTGVSIGGKAGALREFLDAGKPAFRVGMVLRAAPAFFLQGLRYGCTLQLKAGASTVLNEGNTRLTVGVYPPYRGYGVLPEHYVEDVLWRSALQVGIKANGYYDRVRASLHHSVSMSLAPRGDTKAILNQFKPTLSFGGRVSPVADHPPVYVSSPETGVVPGRPYMYKPQVTDDLSVPVVYPGVLPNFLTFNNGTISGVVPYGNVEGLVVSTYAKDDIGSITTQTYMLEVLTPFRTNDLSAVRLYLDNAPARVVTVELTGLRWADQTPRVFYFSNASYVSWPSDSPWNKSFPPLVKDIPAFSRNLNVADFNAETSWGEVTVINNGSLDHLLTDYTTRYRPITIRMGDAMTAYSSFITVIQGCLGERGVTSSNSGTLNIPIRSNAILLEVPLSEDKWSKEDKLNPEKVKPECWGGTVDNPIFNIAPVLIDDANHRYKYHNGRTGGVVKVRDLGVEVAFDDYPLVGEFELKHPPKGDITADVVGGYSKDGKQYSNLVELLYSLVIDKTPITPAMIDTSSFSKLTRMYRNAIGGFYYADGGGSTVKDAAVWLLSSINSYFEFRRNGNMYVREMFEQGFLTRNASLSIDYLFTLDEIGADISPSDILPAMYEVPFGWKKNWNPQTTFADYIHEEALDLKTLYEDPHTKIVKTNTGVQARVVKPEKMDVWESLLTHKETADMVAQSRADLRSVDRRIYTVKVYKFASLLNLGDIVKVGSPRYNLQDYPVIVVGVEDPIVSQIGQIKVIQ